MGHQVRLPFPLPPANSAQCGAQNVLTLPSSRSALGNANESSQRRREPIPSVISLHVSGGSSPRVISCRQELRRCVSKQEMGSSAGWR